MNNSNIVRNESGALIPWNMAVSLMDEEICEELNREIAPCTNQEFFTAYEQRHADKYGEQWELSKANPTY